MDCFLKLGKILHLQIQKLMAHLEIMILVNIYLFLSCDQRFYWNNVSFPTAPTKRNNSFIESIFISYIWESLHFAVDVVEIGSTCAKVGEVLRVKPLATLALIDEGQLDWKIIAVSLDDPRCSLVDDVHDIEKYFPVCLGSMKLTFLLYSFFFLYSIHLQIIMFCFLAYSVRTISHNGIKRCRTPTASQYKVSFQFSSMNVILEA